MSTLKGLLQNVKEISDSARILGALFVFPVQAEVCGSIMFSSISTIVWYQNNLYTDVKILI